MEAGSREEVEEGRKEGDERTLSSPTLETQGVLEKKGVDETKRMTP